jgi:predicted DNA-binding transcriptional regulator AlpA
LLDKRGVARAALPQSSHHLGNARSGELHHVRLSKRCIRFPKQAVLDAMARRTVGIQLITTPLWSISMSTHFDCRDTPLPLTYYEKKYGLSRTTLWRYRKSGLPRSAVGAKSFIKESEFVAFLERNERPDSFRRVFTTTPHQ